MTPKFRAWDRLTGKMFPVGIIDCSIQAVYIEEPNGLDSRRNFDEIELMRFTGLKDKNGREIYKGDIIRFFDCDGDGYTVPVVWDNDYACFSVDWGSNMLTSFDYLEEFYTDLKDIEVIGNIYENLSLIRQENKMETLQEQLLEPQLDIGKAVLESMMEIYFRDGALKGVLIPAKFQDKEFEIEVRMK